MFSLFQRDWDHYHGNHAKSYPPYQQAGSYHQFNPKLKSSEIIIFFQDRPTPSTYFEKEKEKKGVNSTIQIGLYSMLLARALTEVNSKLSHGRSGEKIEGSWYT